MKITSANPSASDPLKRFLVFLLVTGLVGCMRPWYVWEPGPSVEGRGWVQSPGGHAISDELRDMHVGMSWQ